MLAGRIEEARAILDALVAEQPEDIEVRGVRGVIAAIGGDSAQAVEDVGWLENLGRPYLYGTHLFYCGAIVGALGERERAVDLLREAFAEGRYFYLYDWAKVEFTPLREYPSFEELIRPKG
jgi:hypothetical protein